MKAGFQEWNPGDRLELAFCSQSTKKPATLGFQMVEGDMWRVFFRFEKNTLHIYYPSRRFSY